MGQHNLGHKQVHPKQINWSSSIQAYPNISTGTSTSTSISTSTSTSTGTGTGTTTTTPTVTLATPTPILLWSYTPSFFPKYYTGSASS